MFSLSWVNLHVKNIKVIVVSNSSVSLWKYIEHISGSESQASDQKCENAIFKYEKTLETITLFLTSQKYCSCLKKEKSPLVDYSITIVPEQCK